MQQSNVADGKTMIITDSVTAVQIAEPVLFSIYGKDNITLQQPYEIYLIDHYWVISGTLPEEKVGGVFLFILDANDGKIMRITHGK
ncbi:MAG: NTF2 fold immunity protein [Chitinophagales bacterium]